MGAFLEQVSWFCEVLVVFWSAFFGSGLGTVRINRYKQGQSPFKVTSVPCFDSLSAWLELHVSSSRARRIMSRSGAITGRMCS